jgi:hypothetical protein
VIRIGRSGLDQIGVANGVALERAPGPVSGVAVGLDDEALGLPEEVDHVALHVDVDLGVWELRTPAEVEEPLLQRTAGARGSRAIKGEHLREPPAPRATGPWVEAGAIEAQILGLVDGALQRPLDTTSARSTRVRPGLVTGIPSRCVMSFAVNGWRWTLTPSSLRPRSPGTVTSIHAGASLEIPQRNAALPWLSTAPSPQARTAAIKRPSRESAASPVA